MPLYDYVCGQCERVETKLLKMDDARNLIPCDHCIGFMRKQIGAASFILKGTGWYKTDFKGDKPS